MSRDKQIEEMVKAVCIQMRDYPKLTCKKCKADNSSTKAYCRVQFEMERLCNAGYRKASDVAREIFEGVDSTIDLICAMTGLDIKVFGKYAELKKKYTEVTVGEE